MSEEQKLEIVENGQYNNLNLKTNFAKKIKGIEDGNYIIVTKCFAEGREWQGKYGPSYSCKVTYDDTECSFWLNQKEHEVFMDCGGIDDKVKITLKKETYVLNNEERTKQVLYFEKVE